ncbi:calcium/sodium antiporter [archaeon]|nr:calcium/sodium antiporter [archaeon]NCP79076.1 calcium/sodium antiporter [archaeon]NCP97542.1 calcium/sodium antiporter [archaeon]NCQ06843.1 calcium/sodium antiporter [archaeon]NCQ50639.1 calcium/sodium antiporter [archaeon]
MLELFLWILVFLASLFFLIKASSYFIKSSENIGIFLKLPPIIIGVIILSIGTSLPELISSIFAILKGSSEIVVSTVIGSNIANLFLILGITAIIAKKIVVNENVIKQDLPFFIGTSFLLVLILFNGFVSFYETLLLLFVFVFYLIYTIKEIDLSQTIVEKRPRKKDFLVNILIFSISLLAIYISAKYLIDATIKLSTILNIGTEIIAISAIAFGTSLPELIVSIKAVKLKKYDLAVGNIIGSNIFNILGILGVSSIFGKVAFDISSLIFPLGLMFLGTILIYFIILDKKITIQEGILLISFYVLFLLFLFNLL